MTIPRQRLETWDAQSNTMRFQSGRYQLMAGSSSADNTLQKTNIKL